MVLTAGRWLLVRKSVSASWPSHQRAAVFSAGTTPVPGTDVRLWAKLKDRNPTGSVHESVRRPSHIRHGFMVNWRTGRIVAELGWSPLVGRVCPRPRVRSRCVPRDASRVPSASRSGSIRAPGRIWCSGMHLFLPGSPDPPSKWCSGDWRARCVPLGAARRPSQARWPLCGTADLAASPPGPEDVAARGNGVRGAQVYG
jgi:hypothetical protein